MQIVRIIAIFVKDKKEARGLIDKMFQAGYKIKSNEFSGAKAGTMTKIIPIDAPTEDVGNRYEGLEIDLAIIPGNMPENWKKLLRKRLKADGKVQTYKGVL